MLDNDLRGGGDKLTVLVTVMTCYCSTGLETGVSVLQCSLNSKIAVQTPCCRYVWWSGGDFVLVITELNSSNCMSECVV